MTTPPSEQGAAMFDCDIPPRPLPYPLSDYHHAPGNGPLHATWQDKPHRIVYDLVAAVRYYAAASADPVHRRASLPSSEGAGCDPDVAMSLADAYAESVRDGDDQVHQIRERANLDHYLRNATSTSAAEQIEMLDVQNHALRRQVADLQREASTWNAALTALSAKWEKLRAGHPRLEVRFWTGRFWEPLYGPTLDQRLDALEPAPQWSVALSPGAAPVVEPGAQSARANDACEAQPLHNGGAQAGREAEDAARYRWLRDGTLDRLGLPMPDRGERSIDRTRDKSLMVFKFWCTPHELDAAIDAARATQGDRDGN